MTVFLDPHPIYIPTHAAVVLLYLLKMSTIILGGEENYEYANLNCVTKTYNSTNLICMKDYSHYQYFPTDLEDENLSILIGH